MERKIIVIGPHSIEKLCNSFAALVINGYEFHTTAFISNAFAMRQTSSRNIKDLLVEDFSETETVSCVEYINKNNLDYRVGFNEGTAIYYAMMTDAFLLTSDHLTEKICDELGVSHIDEESLWQEVDSPLTLTPAGNAGYSITADKPGQCSPCDAIVSSLKTFSLMTG